jgi:cytochrome P450
MVGVLKRHGRAAADVLGRAGRRGLLIAEGDDWRWQRRIAAPLFRAEALLSYVPAFAAACEPVLARWRKAEPGSLQIIGKDMTDAAMQGCRTPGDDAALALWQEIASRRPAFSPNLGSGLGRRAWQAPFCRGQLQP